MDFKYMLDVKSTQGFTPAHLAAMQNNFDFINYLRENGSNFRLKGPGD